MTEAATFVPPTESVEKPKAKKAKPKAKKEKAPAEPKAPRRSKFAELYPDTAPLTVLADGNPKKVGSKAHANFELYEGCKTVGDIRAKGIAYRTLAYDVGHGFIKIG